MSKPTALITGCSASSLGSFLALAFHARGYRVYAAVRDPAKAAHLASVPDIEIVTLDVTSAESIDALASQLRHRDGKLHILVNNAGVVATGPLIEADIKEARRLYEVNYFGVLSVTQAFVQMLVEAKGKVVNISSVGALLAVPWIGLYSSSKAAVTMMSETLRLELAPLGVTVITAMVGSVESNIHVNDSWQGLPETSRYKSVEAQAAKTASGDIGPKKEKAEDFARHLVDDVLGGASGKVWRGAFAQTSRIMGYLAPMALLDTLLVSGSGLDVMAKEAAKKD